MDRFKLYKKWFWIGLAVGFINPILGLVYGIALVVEKDHRKEGIIIIIWTIVWTISTYYGIIWLANNGYLPTFQLKSPGTLLLP
ncbi:MAG: hypothetical protein Q8N22_03300 [bacterium]|nr:hypothetical protein [bacterium]